MPTLYAGIDEAGYGPLLGPLCVGCAVFVLPHAESNERPPCLWHALRGAVCRSSHDKLRRIAVEDSKKLKGAKDAEAHPLRHLERGVVAFASAVAGAPMAWETDAQLLETLGAAPPAVTAHSPPHEADPWHSETLPLPLGNDAPALRIACSMLRVAIAKSDLQFQALRVRSIEARDFNAQAARISNKATINFMAAALHIDRVRQDAALRGMNAWIALDRQGGRTSYREPLQSSFPESKIRVLEESEIDQRYQLEFPASKGLPAHAAVVSFELGGEERNLPIALASMAAKFARELHMRRINRFFAQHVPELKPTAGYVLDGRRWVEEVSPAAAKLGIPNDWLVRTQ